MSSIPACTIKLTPFARLARSSAGVSPAATLGEFAIADALNSHCAFAIVGVLPVCSAAGAGEGEAEAEAWEGGEGAAGGMGRGGAVLLVLVMVLLVVPLLVLVRVVRGR